MMYGNSKEIFSFAHFSTILVGFDQQSSWFRSDSPTKYKKTNKQTQQTQQNKTDNIKKKIMQIQPVLSYCDIKMKTYVISLSLI